MNTDDRKYFREEFKSLHQKIDRVEQTSIRKDEELKDIIHKVIQKMPQEFPCISNDETKNPLMQISNIKSSFRTLVIVISSATALLGGVYAFIRIIG